MELRLKIEQNMNKVEEKLILEKLRDAFLKENDNYLSMLFTNEFTNWACERISNDFPVDAMEYINDYSKNEEIKQLKVEREHHIQINKELRGEITESDNKIFALKEVSARLVENASSLGMDVSQLYEQLIEKEKMVDNLKNEMTFLKAKLYDLISK